MYCVNSTCTLLGQPCRRDSHCPGYPNTACIGSQCVKIGQECEKNADCPYAHLQCINSKCIKLGSCQSDKECPETTYCIAGRCTKLGQNCYGHYDCPLFPQTACIEGVCVRAGQHCTADSDCPNQMLCISSRCQPIGDHCDVDTDCRHYPLTICVNSKCSKAGRCRVDTDCPGYPQTYCVDNKCTRNKCTIASDCKYGYICENEKCVRKSCTATAGQCPFGFYCDNGICARPNKSCTRDEDCAHPDLVCLHSRCEVKMNTFNPRPSRITRSPPTTTESTTTTTTSTTTTTTTTTTTPTTTTTTTPTTTTTKTITTTTQKPQPRGKIMELSQAIKDKILDMHNYRRSQLAIGKTARLDMKTFPKASAMFELKWDDQLAKEATDHVVKCSMGPSARSARSRGQGENWRVINARSEPNQMQRIKRHAIQYWWAMSRNVPNLPLDVKYRSSLGEKAGFFTQMGWAKTYKIGCAMANCPGGEFFVCHYYPRGNIEGEYMYPKGGPGNNCPDGRSKRYEGLCKTPSW
ncbi:hypothetical protein ANCCAN_01594 [Ancylostoma caninum]|uniref:SCP domain-containing protein n=1 Tax=Ancylostoma caninum TaxID=29170 RepID=A0A368H6G7_ANCCA|nr:hypothetical protein ANCCAN_01594 [Ancylostoma caninum]